jgi:hypothetical protein
MKMISAGIVAPELMRIRFLLPPWRSKRMPFPLFAEANVICWGMVPQTDALVAFCHFECRDN